MAGHGSHAHPTPDVTIDYFAAGDGRAVVLVHGITESRRSWDPLIAPLLAAGYRVVALDLRGHGSSSVVPPFDLPTMVGDLGAVLAAERMTDALLVGHSLGGAVVTAAASTLPCRGVVCVDQSLALGSFRDELLALEPMLRGTKDEFESAVAAVFGSMAGALDGPTRQRVDRVRRPDQDVVLGVWELVLTADPADLAATVDRMVADISVPYLALHGTDPGTSYATWLAEHVPTARLEVWDGLGHYPHLVEPERFVELLVAFDR